MSVDHRDEEKIPVDVEKMLSEFADEDEEPRKRADIKKLMKALRSLRFNPKGSILKISKDAEPYVFVSRSNMLDKRALKATREREQQGLPDMSMFVPGRWSVPRSECVDWSKLPTKQPTSAILAMSPTPTFDHNKQTSPTLTKPMNKLSPRAGKGIGKGGKGKKGVKKPKYSKKNGVCKKIIPCFTHEQKLLMRGIPGISFAQLGKVKFRYVRCTPPQQYCPKCSRANGLDETKCQFCSEVLVEIELMSVTPPLEQPSD